LSSQNLDNWLECLENSFADFNLNYSGGESNNEAMRRASKVIEQFQYSNTQAAIIVTHGNLMTLILRYFDDGFRFNDWKKLTNPDIYKVTLNNEPSVDRVWGRRHIT
jgi:2,3-bisphosphoglycerate-dependent phosphoglycerate mutase